MPGPGQETWSVCMNGQHGPSTIAVSREQHNYARLHGRWLLLARGIWITLVVLSLGTFFASLPVYIARKQTLCAGTECTYGVLLTPSQVEVLKGIGLSLSEYAVYTVAFTLATIVVCLVVSSQPMMAGLGGAFCFSWWPVRPLMQARGRSAGIVENECVPAPGDHAFCRFCS